jgi:two-component system response regulator NreC
VADPGQVEPALIDVVIADDHAMVRAGLRLLLETSPRIRVVAEAGGVESALAAVRAHAPGVAVLDLNMPGGGALPAIPRVLEAVPGVRIVVLTMEEDPALAREAMVAGARAYVLKDAADVELIEGVLAAADDRTYLNPRLGAQLAATAGADDALPVGSTFAGHRSMRSRAAAAWRSSIAPPT